MVLKPFFPPCAGPSSYSIYKTHYINGLVWLGLQKFIQASRALLNEKNPCKCLNNDLESWNSVGQRF